MIWELHRDGNEYLYQGHTPQAYVEPLYGKSVNSFRFRARIYPNKFAYFTSKLEAKSWVNAFLKDFF